MVTKGWLKIYRKLIDWEWFNDANTLQLFIYLLCQANNEKSVFKGIEIGVGQLVVGRKMLAQRLGKSEQTIRTCLAHLKSTNNITIKPTNKFSIITICNYEKYQVNERLNQPTTTPTIQPIINHNERNIEYKERKNNINSSSLPNGTRPQLQEIISECKSKAYNVDPLQFYAYYEANGWLLKENKPMRNWRAALYQWNKKEKGNVMPHATTETMDLTNEHLKKYDHPNAINYDEFLKRQQKS